MFVQFSDSAETTITSYFAGPQDPAVWINQGAIDVSDPRWKAFYNAQSALMQQGLPVPTAS